MNLLARLVTEINSLRTYIFNEKAVYNYNTSVYQKKISDLEQKVAELENTTRAQEREITRLIGVRNS